MSSKLELFKIFRAQQEKYVYYIIALSVAAIGFSVHLTTNIKVDFYHIPLGLAVIFWVASVYYGLSFIELVISSTYTNLGLVDVQEGTNPLSGKDPVKMKIGSDTLREILEKNSDKGERLKKRQDNLFYLASGFFLLYHICNMVLNQMPS